jgi:hypothetical protein
MADFNYNLKLDPSTFGGSSYESSWKPDSDSWNKAFNSKTDYSDFGKYTDPFDLNKDKDKKESPWGDVFRFAGDKLSSYAQNRYGQGGGFAGGGGGVSQSGDLTIVYPQSPTVIEGKKSGLGGSIGGILGTVAGIALAPATGGASMALGPALGSAVGGAFG